TTHKPSLNGLKTNYNPKKRIPVFLGLILSAYQAHIGAYGTHTKCRKTHIGRIQTVEIHP
ncbi:hypothetical protein, partial [Bacillus thuringiensis]|uniref:hypothetical protein n=1 Tax=Bacillus thuringiensis TaxID=1428 RepID=UPI001F39C421